MSSSSMLGAKTANQNRSSGPNAKPIAKNSHSTNHPDFYDGSTSLRMFAMMATCADKGAVRDLSKIDY